MVIKLKQDKEKNILYAIYNQPQYRWTIITKYNYHYDSINK